MRDYKFGQVIYDFRKRANLTQEELARELGVTDKAVSKWESGVAKPTTQNIRKLADIFNVSVEELLTMKEGQSEKKL